MSGRSSGASPRPAGAQREPARERDVPLDQLASRLSIAGRRAPTELCVVADGEIEGVEYGHAATLRPATRASNRLGQSSETRPLPPVVPLRRAIGASRLAIGASAYGPPSWVGHTTPHGAREPERPSDSLSSSSRGAAAARPSAIPASSMVTPIACAHPTSATV